MTPTLVTSPESAGADFGSTALYVPSTEAAALRPVQACAGRLGAAGLSPEGAIVALGRPRGDCI